jgi:hypothetical protein
VLRCGADVRQSDGPITALLRKQLVRRAERMFAAASGLAPVKRLAWLPATSSASELALESVAKHDKYRGYRCPCLKRIRLIGRRRDKTDDSLLLALGKYSDSGEAHHFTNHFSHYIIAVKHHIH